MNARQCDATSGDILMRVLTRRKFWCQVRLDNVVSNCTCGVRRILEDVPPQAAESVCVRPVAEHVGPILGSADPEPDSDDGRKDIVHLEDGVRHHEPDEQTPGAEQVSGEACWGRWIGRPGDIQVHVWVDERFR